MANTEENPEEQYFYRTLAKEQSVPECLTCKTGCKFHHVEMSTENNYYTLVCSGPNVPEVGIFKTVRSKKIIPLFIATE